MFGPGAWPGCEAQGIYFGQSGSDDGSSVVTSNSATDDMSGDIYNSMAAGVQGAAAVICKFEAAFRPGNHSWSFSR